MNKPALALLLPVAVLSALAVAGSGSAQSPPEGRTFTMFEDARRETGNLIDNAPRSPSANPGSRRFRLSAGDGRAAKTPLYDRRGGRRVGTLYSEGTVVSGSRFEDARWLVHGVASLAGGEIVFEGIVADRRVIRVAVIGGTGDYEGARGHVESVDVAGGIGSQDTVRLLP